MRDRFENRWYPAQPTQQADTIEVEVLEDGVGPVENPQHHDHSAAEGSNIVPLAGNPILEVQEDTMEQEPPLTPTLTVHQAAPVLIAQCCLIYATCTSGRSHESRPSRDRIFYPY